MNCEVCGTELPHGAMFCGECGRAVGARPVTALHPDSGMPIEQSRDAAVAPQGAPGPRDTMIIEPVDPESLAAQPAPVPAPAENGFLEPDPHEPEPLEPEPLAPGSLEPDAGPIPEEVEQDLDPAELPPIEPSEGAVASGEAVRPDPFPWGDRGTAIFSDSDELEQTLIVPRRETGERFVLQFSTGESFTVFGSGLLGRNPMPQPGEYFDQLIGISDPGKSVSKTHLEFGQELGSFWVSDRYSGNGSIVREPESAAHRLVAGRRYRIVRGTRVDIGEQFFVVS